MPMRNFWLAVMLLALAACATPTPHTPLPATLSDSATGFRPPAALYLCPGMRVSFAPQADADRRIFSYRPTVDVNGVALFTSPVTQVCLSRAAGRHSAGAHEGLDLAPYPRERVRMVRAGGAGLVREVGERHDFGIYVLIDHGNGVFTRYAHLAFVSPGMATGRRVAMGEPLGQMGGTGNVPIHLHYAILHGDYETPRASFGLTPVNPFELVSRTG